jgi:hypothetical protein
VQKLDGLVKGYRPNYEFHGVPVPGPILDAVPESDLPPDPASPSKSVH